MVCSRLRHAIRDRGSESLFYSLMSVSYVLSGDQAAVAPGLLKRLAQRYVVRRDTLDWEFAYQRW